MYLSSKEVEKKIQDIETKYKAFQKEYKRLVSPIKRRLYRLKKVLIEVREREDRLFNPQKIRRKKTRTGLRKKDYPYFEEWLQKQKENQKLKIVEMGEEENNK